MSQTPTQVPPDFDHTTELFFTANRFLAKAIAFAGVPFSVYREYDENYLASHGVKTVKEAEARRLPGRENWIFRRTPNLAKIVEAFDAENAAIDALVAEGKDLPFCEDARAETKCREFVRAIRGNRLIDQTLFSTTPFLRFWEDGKGKPTIKDTPKGKVAVWPASKVIPLNATPEVKAHLNL